MSGERLWMLLALLLVVTAAAFLWRNNLSVAFVTAALGACAWFLSYRSQLRNKFPDEPEPDDEASEESNED